MEVQSGTLISFESTQCPRTGNAQPLGMNRSHSTDLTPSNSSSKLRASKSAATICTRSAVRSRTSAVAASARSPENRTRPSSAATSCIPMRFSSSRAMPSSPNIVGAQNSSFSIRPSENQNIVILYSITARRTHVKRGLRSGSSHAILSDRKGGGEKCRLWMS